MIRTKNKVKFLTSEYRQWPYWRGFSYKEFLKENLCDLAKCDCGTYHWKDHVKPCDCTP